MVFIRRFAKQYLAVKNVELIETAFEVVAASCFFFFGEGYTSCAIHEEASAG